MRRTETRLRLSNSARDQRKNICAALWSRLPAGHTPSTTTEKPDENFFPGCEGPRWKPHGVRPGRGMDAAQTMEAPRQSHRKISPLPLDRTCQSPFQVEGGVGSDRGRLGEADRSDLKRGKPCVQQKALVILLFPQENKNILLQVQAIHAIHVRSCCKTTRHH